MNFCAGFLASVHIVTIFFAIPNIIKIKSTKRAYDTRPESYPLPVGNGFLSRDIP